MSERVLWEKVLVRYEQLLACTDVLTHTVDKKLLNDAIYRKGVPGVVDPCPMCHIFHCSKCPWGQAFKSCNEVGSGWDELRMLVEGDYEPSEIADHLRYIIREIEKRLKKYENSTPKLENPPIIA